MAITEATHYSVRDENDKVWGCYCYESMASTVAVRESSTSRPLHVEHVRDCECRHGYN